MLSSVFLAKILGLIIIVVTLPLIFSKNNLDLFFKFYEDRTSILAKGIVNVILGVLLLIYQNVWTTNLDKAISVFCWLILIVGLMSLFFPEYLVGMLGRLFFHRVLILTSLNELSISQVNICYN